jgi:hypothetical protein
MGLKLYCNRYTHFKDPLVCSVVCPYRTRCRDFALYYDAHRDEVDGVVENYFAARRSEPQRPRAIFQAAPAAEIRALIRLEVKREMAEAAYIWIGKDDQAELLELDEIIRRAERGAKAKNIYKVSQEMELRFQLVPRKRIDKAKRDVAVEQQRAAARRKPSRPRPVAVETPVPLTPSISTEAVSAQPPQRRTRPRIAKVAGQR